MNQVFTNQKNELTFTKNYSTITSSTKLSALEKLLIARVLNWQQNNLVCTLSNNALANELGESLKTIKRTITKLNKTSFFKSQETSKFNEFGKWTNSKEIIIDEQALFDFVNDKTPLLKTIKSNDDILPKIEENLQPEVIKPLTTKDFIKQMELEYSKDSYQDFDDELDVVEVEPQIKEQLQPEIDNEIKDLIEFVDQYNQTFSGGGGKYLVIKKFVRDGKLSDKQSIIDEFESNISTVA